MKLIKKYICLFVFIWLQFYYFFDEVNALTKIEYPMNLILGIMAIYCIAFFIYFFLLLTQRINKEINRKIDGVFFLGGLLFAGVLGYYHLSNNWLWTEANTAEIILDTGKTVCMLVAIILANIFHFVFKEDSGIGENVFWNTDKTFDLVFFCVFCITAFGLSVSTSRMIPYTNRNYFEFLRVSLVLTLIFSAWYNGRLFQEQRNLFYAILIGYFIACLLESANSIFIFNPLIQQQLVNLGIETTRLQVANIFICINLGVLAAWIGNALYQEKKKQKLV